MNYDYLNSHKWDSNVPCGTLGIKGEAEYQAKLDEIAGREPNGTHRFKLEWGQRSLVFDVFRNEWMPRFIWGKPSREFVSVSGVLMPKMKIIGVPRYVLLGFTGKYTAPKYQQDGWSFDGHEYEKTPTGLLSHRRETKRHAMPDVPEYRVEHVFSAHQKRTSPTAPYAPCCTTRLFMYDSGFDRCWGRYVEPSQIELDEIKIALAEQWETFKHAPTGSITKSQYSWLQKRMEDAAAKERAEEAADDAYNRKHNLPTLANALNAAAGERRWSMPTGKKVTGEL